MILYVHPGINSFTMLLFLFVCLQKSHINIGKVMTNTNDHTEIKVKNSVGNNKGNKKVFKCHSITYPSISVLLK